MININSKMINFNLRFKSIFHNYTTYILPKIYILYVYDTKTFVDLISMKLVFHRYSFIVFSQSIRVAFFL